MISTTQLNPAPAEAQQQHAAGSSEEFGFWVSIFKSKQDNVPQRTFWSLERMAEKLTTHKTRRTKDGAAWSPATFEGRRSKEGAHEVCALVLDYDDGAAPLDVTRDFDEQGLCYIVHTTHSHTSEIPKFRLILPLARPVPAADWPKFYAKAARRFGRGLEDESCKDASRLYFLPACLPNEENAAFSFYLPGVLLDPDDVPEDAAPADRVIVPRPATIPGTMRPYVRAAFERECDAVGRAANGTRNKTLNRAAFNLFQIVASNELDAATVENKLLDIALSMGLPEAEALRTIQSGREAGLKRPRQLPEPKTQPGERPTSSNSAPAIETSADARGPYPLNEIGNGQRFADAHRGRFLFDFAANRWRTHERGVWRYSDGDDVERAAKLVEQQVCAEARAEDDDDRRAKLYKHAATLTKRKTRETMLKDVASEEGMSASPEAFDAQLHLLNVQNGTLDLRSFELRPHDPRDLLTKCAGTIYDPKAGAPTWTQVIETWQESEANRVFLQKAFGLSLTGEVLEEILLLLLGVGANGKTTALRTKQKLLGTYAHHAQAETLMKARDPRRAGAPAPDIVALKGARLLTASEIAADAELHAAFVKDATGRDPLTARGCHDNRLQTFIPQFTLWLVGNHKPRIKDTSDGIWRRVKLVPFEVQIAPEHRDPSLAQKLEAELPGILNWALDGLRRYYSEGLQTPSEIEAATEAYRSEQDPVAGFIAECCERSRTAYVPAAELWQAFAAYCDARDEPAGTQTAFGSALSDKGFKPDSPRIDGKKTRVRCGLRLKKSP